MIISKQSKDLVNELLKDDDISKYTVELMNNHPETFEHSKRVAALTIDLAHENSLSHDDIKTLGMAGLLHDIGKIDVPNSILNKEDKLINDEREEIKKHSRYGFERIVEDRFSKVKAVMVGHHEFDKTPYPRKKNLIVSFLDRRKNNYRYLTEVLAAADMFDALNSPRSYKEPFSKEKIEEIMREQFTGDDKLVSQVLKRF
jgi:putative nucleotidyltransferase with HDIG domain